MNKAQLLAKTKAELLEMAKRLGLRGISTLRKPALAGKIHVAQEKRLGGAAARARAAAIAADEAKRRAIRKRPSDARRPAATVSPPAELAAHKFDVTPSPRRAKRPVAATAGEALPESYGTGRVFLTARDPHWLYAYWDLSPSEMAAHREKAIDGRLMLRLFEQNQDRPMQEIALQADSRNWYIFVNKAATTYRTQLGYWQRRGGFKVIGESRETATPPDALAAAEPAQFVTIPLDLPFQDLYGMVRAQVQSGEPLARALHRLQEAGQALPFPTGRQPEQLTAAQATALTHLVWDDLLRRSQSGSVEISEWLRRRLAQELGSGVLSGGFSAPSGSWQVALGQPQKGFWFAVNAELILYGATEPSAKVTIDGQPIELRPDGTFSFHYVFPDGQYRLPIVAIAADGDQRRAVQLTFDRQTRIEGEVGQVKSPAQLKTPVAA